MSARHWIWIVAVGLAACSAPPKVPPFNAAKTERQFTTQAEQDFAQQQFMVYDPAEGANKQVYKFNAKLDKYVLLPIVDAYKYVTPGFVRRGVTNFFMNVGEVHNFTNALLQAKPYQATKTLGRFMLNTTVGLAGTVDVATDAGLKRHPEDFGKTLGYWGAGSGAYIMLPVLGPSNVRDTVGAIADYATMYFIIPDSVQNSTAYAVAAYGLQPIDARYSNEFRYFSTGSPFEYELVRYIVTQARNLEIANGRK